MKNPLALLHRRRLFRQEHALLSNPAPVDDRQRMADLRRSVDHAAAASPFYKAHLRGHDTSSVDSLEALRRLPFTTKADLLAGPDRANPDDASTTWGTSGSSGQPYVFAVDRDYAVRHEASRAAVYTRAGLARRATVVELLPGNRVGQRADLSQPVHRRFVVGYGRPDFVDLALDRQPSLLYGNRSHLMEFCTFLEDNGRTVSLEHIVSSSEMLLETDRLRLEQTTGAAIHDLYGSAESSNIAYRLATDSGWTPLTGRLIVEVIDEAGEPVGPGDRGEITVTTLREPTSPMVRYRTGDVAVVAADAPGPADGRPDITFDRLEGRQADALVDHGGQRLVSSWAIGTSGFWAAGDVGSSVRQWRVVQAADRSIDVHVVLHDGAELASISPEIVSHVHRAVGPVEVRVHREAQLHDPTNGKFRAVTSAATLASR